MAISEQTRPRVAAGSMSMRADPPPVEAPLNVAYLVDKFPSLSETFILNQITGLLDLGHDVDIYPAYRGGFLEAHEDVHRYKLLARTYCSPLPPVKTGRNLRVLGLLATRLANRGDLLAMLWKAWRARPDAVRLKPLPLCYGRFRNKPYDVVHCHFAPSGNLGAVLKAMGAVAGKVVVTFHGYDMRMGEEAGAHIYRPLRELADRFLSIAPRNRRQLEAWGFPAEKIIDHPVGVNLDRFRPPVAHERPPGMRLLTVARLVDVKALDVALRVVDRLRRRSGRSELSYFIVGDGPRYKDLLELADNLGMLDIVHFCRGMVHEQVAQTMAKCDVYLLSSRAELSPVSVMEALASGIPVVAMEVGAIRDIVDDGRSGFVVPPHDLESMVQKLEYLRSNPETARAMGLYGRRMMQRRRDIRILNERLAGIFRELAGDARLSCG